MKRTNHFLLFMILIFIFLFVNVCIAVSEPQNNKGHSGETLKIGDNSFHGWTIDTEHSKILVIRGNRGMLGCGYLNIDVANKLGDALACVSGVNSYDDMLKAYVNKVSDAAVKLGVKQGMSGREALELMK